MLAKHLLTERDFRDSRDLRPWLLVSLRCPHDRYPFMVEGAKTVVNAFVSSRWTTVTRCCWGHCSQPSSVSSGCAKRCSTPSCYQSRVLEHGAVGCGCYKYATPVRGLGVVVCRCRYLMSVSVFGIFVGIFLRRFGIRYRYCKISRYRYR